MEHWIYQWCFYVFMDEKVLPRDAKDIDSVICILPLNSIW